MIQFTNMSAAGLLPQFLSEADPRPAQEQLHTAYAHGGGWHDCEGFKLVERHEKRLGQAKPVQQYALAYPGDPHMREVSRAKLRDETVVLFESAWVAVIQPNGDFRIARMD